MKNKIRKPLSKSQSEYRTFDEWKDVGRYVRQGEKCTRDKNGRAVFSLEQTEPNGNRSPFVLDLNSEFDEEDPYCDPYIFN